MIKELLLAILFWKTSHGNDFRDGDNWTNLDIGSTRCGKSQSLQNANGSLLEVSNEKYHNCLLDWEKISKVMRESVLLEMIKKSSNQSGCTFESQLTD